MQQVTIDDGTWNFVSIEQVNGVNIGISDEGDRVHYVDNYYHNEDGPAIEYVDGTKIWYLNGELHREDGPAFEDIDGDKEWYINGKLHREDGPAIDYVGYREYWLNGVKQDVNPICKTKRTI